MAGSLLGLSVETAGVRSAWRVQCCWCAVVFDGANGAVIANYAPLIQASQLLATQNADPTAMIMAARTRHTLGGLVDTTGQPLNMPKLLEGYQQLWTNAVPVNQTQGTSNDCSTILVGDFRQLYIGVRQGLRIEVLRERYADQMQYGFIAHLRADVAAAQPSNFCKVIGIKP
ncbi:MAG: phage major capsid protein [Permianibacter sp.]